MTSTMFVRNTQTGPTIFNEDGYDFLWQGKGDPNGTDVLPVPPELAKSYAFQRCVYQGVLEVTHASADILAELASISQAWTDQLGEPGRFAHRTMRDLTVDEIVGVNTEDNKAVPRTRTIPVHIGETMR